MEIGPKPFIIAELSGNHGGRIDRLLNMIGAARESGCDAVKIQLYEPEDLCDPANNHIYERAKVPRHWLPEIFGCADVLEIPLFSSVFAPWAVEELEKYNCSAYKLASPESTRLPAYGDLVEAITATSETFIASSGIADWEFVNSLAPDYLLFCKAGYPAVIDAHDLAWGGFDGFSDHTNDIIAPLAFIGAGAKIIEKHFKIDEQCVDAAFSLNPQQMKLLCDIAHR